MQYTHLHSSPFCRRYRNCEKELADAGSETDAGPPSGAAELGREERVSARSSGCGCVRMCAGAGAGAVRFVRVVSLTVLFV